MEKDSMSKIDELGSIEIELRGSIQQMTNHDSDQSNSIEPTESRMVLQSVREGVW